MKRFDSKALYAALDAQREARHLSWREAAREIGVSVSTIARTRRGGRMEVDGMLAMVAWLGVADDRHAWLARLDHRADEDHRAVDQSDRSWRGGSGCVSSRDSVAAGLWVLRQAPTKPGWNPVSRLDSAHHGLIHFGNSSEMRLVIFGRPPA